MANEVNQWVQEGHLWVWRYRNPSSNCRGWHFSADPPGCRSVMRLLDGMGGGPACHRTLSLASVTEDVLSVPNYSRQPLGRFDRLRIEFQPDVLDLSLNPNDDRLVLVVGNARLRKLVAAFADLEIGGGDFGIATSDSRRSDPWMFWWPPRAFWKYA